jgi:hypothetical protein
MYKEIKVMEDLEKFFEEIQHPIEQCKSCPEKSNLRPIWPLSIKKENI